MKHFLMITLLASLFSGSVFALGEKDDFECAALAESNDRENKKLKEDSETKQSKDNSAVEM